MFGGNTNHGGIATNDIHAITLVQSGEPEVDYHLIPALPAVEGGALPDPIKFAMSIAAMSDPVGGGGTGKLGGGVE